MRNGVVIGCVGVVAAAAVAIVVYTQPPASATSDLQPTSNALRKPAAGPGHGARPATPAAPAAKNPAPRIVAKTAHSEPATSQSSVLPAAYRVLLTRSIFCPRGIGPAASGKSSEPTLTLRGVVAQWPRGFTAYIENSASGEYRAVRVGDTIGQKKVTRIEIHSVEFVEGKRATKVAVGQQLSSTGNGSALATVRPQLD